jgi:hypothetical protein
MLRICREGYIEYKRANILGSILAMDEKQQIKKAE